MSHWGSELGIGVLKQLSELYVSLVWETVVLESLRQTDPDDRQLPREDLDFLADVCKCFADAPEDISGETQSNCAFPRLLWASLGMWVFFMCKR